MTALATDLEDEKGALSLERYLARKHPDHSAVNDGVAEKILEAVGVENGEIQGLA